MTETLKLIDPTLDELDAVFAEKVVGMEIGFPFSDGSMQYKRYGETGFAWCPVESKFTRSFDAVLPWLDKWATVKIDISVDVRITVSETPSMMSCPPVENGWAIVQRNEPNALPRAAVIALLRAHGVEITFTK